MIAERDPGRSGGFGFGDMEAAEAKNAMSSLDGAEHQGRKLRVNEAEKRTQRY